MIGQSIIYRADSKSAGLARNATRFSLLLSFVAAAASSALLTATYFYREDSKHKKRKRLVLAPVCATLGILSSILLNRSLIRKFPLSINVSKLTNKCSIFSEIIPNHKL
ncbi:MAG: hypothetical protein MHPSP_003470, partial [Paramarteilia canceri]